jgi:very-short-patch-repair endonuclease
VKKYLKKNQCKSLDSEELKMENKDEKTLNFIKESKDIHGEDRYDYTETIYINTQKKFILTCNQGHRFETTYKSHIDKKRNCKKCSKIKVGKLLQERAKQTFVQKAKKIHGDLYDYDLVDYKGTFVHVKIKCKAESHIFEILPYAHLSIGQGCKFCNEKLLKEEKRTLNKIVQRKTIKWTKEIFIQESKKIYNDKFDYSLVEFTRKKDNIILKCNENNHVFTTTICSHLEGKGCIVCNLNAYILTIRNTNEDFINKSKSIFGENKFNYSKVNYVTNKIKVILICNEKNHEFEVQPIKHYLSIGCPKCINKSESLLFEKIKPFYNSIIHQYYFKNNENIKTYPFDFLIEEYKIIIELDGDHHFRDVLHHDSKVVDRQRIDFLKMMFAMKNGYSIIRIYQPDILIKNFDWLSILRKCIQLYEKPSYITISNKESSYNEYTDNFFNYLIKNKHIYLVEPCDCELEEFVIDEE